MDFKAEIIRTSQRKLASNDNQYEVVFRTDNPMLLDLGKLKSDSVVQVRVELESEKSAMKDSNEFGKID